MYTVTSGNSLLYGRLKSVRFSFCDIIYTVLICRQEMFVNYRGLL